MRTIEGRVATALLVLAWAALSLAGPGQAQEAGAKKDSSQTIGGMKLSGDKPIQIESDKLEVHQNDNTAIFSGNVNVVQGNTTLKSGRMVVHYVKGSSGNVTRSARRA